MKNRKEKVINFIKKDTVLCISFLLAILSMIAVPADKEYIGYIDYRTLGLLLALMLIMAGFQGLGLFQKLGRGLLNHVNNSRAVAAVLIFLCFFSSMFITNDVALITFVPLTIIVLKMAGLQELLIPTVVLQTVAANLGSMLLPFGNPQNLYLYGRSGLGMSEFIMVILPYGIFSFVLLFVHLLFLKKIPVNLGDMKENEVYSLWEKLQMVVLLVLFLGSVLAVARVFPWIYVVGIVVITVFLMNRKLFLQVDYSLLFTFVFFFAFIGNLGRIPQFCTALEGILEGNEVITAILASQVISNVPAALLLSGFTDKWEALIIGSNLGGLGTLIASMASLISYKQIVAAYPKEKGKYFKYFTVVNVCYLVLLVLFWGIVEM